MKAPGSHTVTLVLGTLVCAWLLSTGMLMAACTLGCDTGCKAHNRWCGTWLGAPAGYQYRSNVAFTDYCSEVPDKGRAVEYDTISYDVFPNCTKDCANDTKTTVAPGGMSFTTQSERFKTKCAKGS